MRRDYGYGVMVGLLLAAGCGSDSGTGGMGSGVGGGAGTGGVKMDGGMGGTGGPLGMGGAGGGTVIDGAAGGAGMGGGIGAGGFFVTGGSGAGGLGTGGVINLDANGSGGGRADAGEAGGAGGGTALIPPALTVPAGATLQQRYHGVGVQIYTCTASGGVDAGADGGAGSAAWVLKAPDAKLLDSTGAQVGSHGAGPSWTSLLDGSVVHGLKIMQVDAPNGDAIPWLLLRASSTSGQGVFANTSYIQRLNTVGGLAPATGCDPTSLGSEVRVDYSADYEFYSGGGVADWLVSPAGIPPTIAAPAGAILKLHDRGIGVQIYTCTASTTVDAGVDAGATTYDWVLKAPDATLYDATYAQVGIHGAGPHWTSVDGSTINGTRIAQANAPAPGDIPWLLLSASPTSRPGVFDDVVYVQRLNTAGGVAPAAGCDATTLGSVAWVSYAADYYFFARGALDGGAVD